MDRQKMSLHMISNYKLNLLLYSIILIVLSNCRYLLITYDNRVYQKDQVTNNRNCNMYKYTIMEDSIYDNYNSITQKSFNFKSSIYSYINESIESSFNNYNSRNICVNQEEVKIKIINLKYNNQEKSKYEVFNSIIFALSLTLFPYYLDYSYEIEFETLKEKYTFKSNLLLSFSTSNLLYIYRYDLPFRSNIEESVHEFIILNEKNN